MSSRSQAALRRGGARIPAHRVLELPTALEVLGEHHRVPLAHPLEPCAGDAVPEPAIGLGEAGIRTVAHERVPECIHLGFGRRRSDVARHELLRLELQQGGVELGRAAEHRGDPVQKERLAVHARPAEHASRSRFESLEARLHHGRDGVRQRASSAVGDGADQLFEVAELVLPHARGLGLRDPTTENPDNRLRFSSRCATNRT